MKKPPQLIYGTAWKKERTKDLVIQAIRSGFRAIDTACQLRHYNEAGVGEALEQLYHEGISRGDIFLQTKFTPVDGHDADSIPYDKDAVLEQQVLQSFERSQQNLRSDYVDALILHSPLFPFKHLIEVWRGMEKLHNEKKALQIGISNCYDLSLLKKLYEHATIKPTIVQNRFYADSNYDTELRQWCLAHDITYESFWSLTANPHILNSLPLLQLARKYSKSIAQIFYRFLTQQGITPLDGTTSLEHMQEDLESFDITLSDEECETIKRLLS